jgi:hypothetical protein
VTEHHREHDEHPHDDPAPDASSPLDATDDTPTVGAPPDEVPPPPETGDIVIDSALRELAAAPADDLDAQLATGEAVHRTLQSRLSDLGG